MLAPAEEKTLLAVYVEAAGADLPAGSLPEPVWQEIVKRCRERNLVGFSLDPNEPWMMCRFSKPEMVAAINNNKRI